MEFVKEVANSWQIAVMFIAVVIGIMVVTVNRRASLSADRKLALETERDKARDQIAAAERIAKEKAKAIPYEGQGGGGEG